VLWPAFPLLALSVAAAVAPSPPSAPTQASRSSRLPELELLDFNRDVRPILSDRCFGCHGPDAAKRKAGLRLDTAEGAYAALRDGGHAIVPGDPDASEAARRVRSNDPDEIMPPPELKRPLSEAERTMLLRWIAQGAEYKPHWAFVPPRALAAHDPTMTP